MLTLRIVSLISTTAYVCEGKEQQVYDDVKRNCLKDHLYIEMSEMTKEFCYSSNVLCYLCHNLPVLKIFCKFRPNLVLLKCWVKG